jgi:uncharacterized protein YjbI with pentapeptide repeats
MANEKHLAILKEGVQAWNRWRGENPAIEPDLRDADLNTLDLGGANFKDCDLSGAGLSGAELSGADLRGANLARVTIAETELVGANLTGANLFGAEFFDAGLSGSILVNADLSFASLVGVNFWATDLSNSKMFGTVMGDIDLSTVIGLETVQHDGPSTIGIDTIYLSQGKIPEVFLRGAGLPESFIANMKALVAAMASIEFYSCFISFSSKDEEFAKKLHWNLQGEKVRCWFAPEDLKIGDKFRTKIDEAVRMYDKLLLVLSKDSVKSPWVQSEVEAAFEKERKKKRTVLFPIRLDDAVMETQEAWAADIRRARHIGDFSDWKNQDEYQKAFGRLMRDLKAEEKGRG